MKETDDIKKTRRRMRQITFLLEEKYINELGQLSARHNITKSSIIRLCVKMGLLACKISLDNDNIGEI